MTGRPTPAGPPTTPVGEASPPPNDTPVIRPTLGSLCTGIGGLDLAVAHHYGAQPIWCAENDQAPTKVLAHHFPDLPNLGDFTKTDDIPAVDIITGGFPCQPFSQAGKRRGTSDERWLFDDILDVVGRMDPRPRVLVFENVAGLLSANGGDAMARVVQGMAALGYMGAYGVLGSSDVGGCHGRQRVWIVATDPGREEWPAFDLAQPGGPAAARDEENRELGRRGEPPADPGGPALRDLSGGVPGPQGPRPEDGHRPGHPGRADPPALLPTPAAWDGDRGPDYARNGRDGAAGREGSGGDDLVTAVARLLPTPVVNDMGEGKTIDEWDEWTSAMRDRHRNGNGHGASLSIEAQRLLPTPTVIQGRNESSGRSNPDSQHHTGTTLNDVAFTADFGKYQAAIDRWAHIFGQPPPHPTITAKGHPRLNPDFVEWMMGYPAGWTDVADLARTNRLKCLGNAVQPQTAAAALHLLTARTPAP